MSRRVALFAAAVVALAAVLVALGRWERVHRADAQNAGIRRLVGEIGPIATSHPDLFRFLPNFQCLLYERGVDRLAIELCADTSGRVVEAIDRRSKTRIWSLRDDPHRAAVHVDRAAFDRQLVRLGVPRHLIQAVHGAG